MNTRRYCSEQETRQIETNLTLIHNITWKRIQQAYVCVCHYCITLVSYQKTDIWNIPERRVPFHPPNLDSYPFWVMFIWPGVHVRHLAYSCDENENLLFDFWVQRHRSDLITKYEKIDSWSDERIVVHRLRFWSLLWFPLLAAYDSSSPCANTQI